MSKSRYEMDDEEAEEGFQRIDALNDQHYIIAKKMEETEEGSNRKVDRNHLKKHKANFQIKQKPKIRFDPLQIFPLTTRNKRDSEKYIKSMSLQKTTFDEGNQQILLGQPQPAAKEVIQGKDRSFEELVEAAIVKTKRTQIGEDLFIRVDEHLQASLKEAQSNAVVVFKKRAYRSTHDIFKDLAKYSNSYFLKSKYNNVLRSNLEKSQYKHQETPKFTAEGIQFQACHQSSNLSYATKANDEEFNLFLSVDTNTKGHQSWFYFTVTNQQETERNVLINICNIKRKFPMIKLGQGVYKRVQGKQWEFIEEVQISCIEKKKYKLSFRLLMKQLQRVELSLIPPYTYSDLLREVETYEKSVNAKVDILTYSLAGLAVPVLTITKSAKTTSQAPKNKNLYLITARIHPSETCSSFIVSALVQELLSNRDYEDFLKNNVVKIVPMVNPDGVIFGNFRTNYLGVDLNRSFHFVDESVYPETVALKELGRKCKEDYGSNFICYLDLHGHSSQASSFIYGPEYPQGCENYVQCRILPKILDKVSSYFRYDYSSFRLEQYKFNTARGYFFKKLKIPAYTIETSYALYCQKTKQEEYHRLGVPEWQDLGRSIAHGLMINFQCFSMTQEQKQASKQEGNEKEKEQRRRKIKSTHKIEQNPNFARYVQSKSSFLRLKKEIINQIKDGKSTLKTVSKRQQSDNDSDGQDAEQDLSQQQKSLIIRRLNQTVRAKSMFPKVSKQSKQPKEPASIPPQIIPTFYIGNHNDINILERINSKFRNKRYNRPVNISQEYTEYLLRNITGVSSLRPEVISFNPKKCKPNPLKLSNESP